ncbi:30S ribosomal protein S7 [Hydrogenivirga sp. 128-5-R1-1]|uniref:30S ribosomal protein S7 n=1 Tax=Hydrogenivirga sp. 128-5-R1-1 TaxID=392423 RepID=UPI00015EF69F|nr:30S ribosomal protein S7 [Hydrogenivirga sp. 128-5-R1-1]EDP73047.1 30S ribosomal protein S7 [Hydrogenivirga sp. 128-5-R1-1]
MPRKGPVKPREIMPDPVYQDVLVHKLINKVMKDGKKSKAEKIVYTAMKILAEKTGEEPLAALHKAIENIKPVMEVRPRRVGGSTYQVPMEVPPRRQESLALRWLVEAARSRSGKGNYTMIEKLSNELYDAYNERGGAVKKKEDTHRMAEANKAFAHYRW